ncbi:unnamed protein product [Aspergillus oryzae var. brunneus]|uniref:Unnamed protein product n=2 Tax=Aspergillus oryzae TaxID=5062 RepID=A0AAN5BYY9_ASPOZ|nr:unnamed protein product [Aspergillus oryzae]GMG48284.1 unnamed protein product [Aspergillus oryzae var. brunneus]
MIHSLTTTSGIEWTARNVTTMRHSLSSFCHSFKLVLMLSLIEARFRLSMMSTMSNMTEASESEWFSQPQRRNSWSGTTPDGVKGILDIVVN